MSNTGRGYRSYSRASRETRWRAFDALPRAARVALNYADHNWWALDYLHIWKSGRVAQASELVKIIKRDDREETKRQRKMYRVLSILAAGIALMAPFAAPAQAQGCWCDQHRRWFCSPGCVITQCYPISDGYRRGERCHWVCRREEPRYVEPQVYDPPPRHQPSYSSPGPDPFGMAILALFVVLGLWALFGDESSESSDYEADVEEIAGDTVSTKQITERLEAAMREADQHLEKAISKLRRGDKDD